MDNTQNSKDESAPALDDNCMESWLAYNDMFEAKQKHYEFLEVLENKKKKFNLAPSEADLEKLADYLSQHDVQVKRFVQLSTELKASEPESHNLLIKFITHLGDGIPSRKVQH